MNMIYADNAATTRLSDAALQAMLPYLQSEYGNASQPYSPLLVRLKQLSQKHVKRLLNA